MLGEFLEPILAFLGIGIVPFFLLVIIVLIIVKGD